ncbi:MAG: hypothetical protein IPP69_08850 [Flavobacteriales bacterium]|nr:hypothetical protein [Flavobacteriales bacterium]
MNYHKMLHQLSLTSITLFMCMFSHGQGNHFEWARYFGGPGFDINYDVELDAEGNIYMAGYFSDSATFELTSGPVTYVAAGAYDGFVMKTDPDGNALWVAVLQGTGVDNVRALAIDHSGDIVACGMFENTSDFDPSTSESFELTAAGSVDAYIWKLNSDGQFIWAKRVGSAAYDESYGIDVDENDNVFIGGIFDGTADFDPSDEGVFEYSPALEDVFILKLDTDGMFVWANQIASDSYLQIYKLVTDVDGSVIISGGFNAVTDFNPGTETLNVTPMSPGETFILKLNNNGEYVWNYHIKGSAFSLAVNQYNDLFITGRIDGAVDFIPGAGVFNLTGYMNAFVARLNQDGVFQWAVSFGANGMDDGDGIAADEYGSIYITGNFESGVDFDPGPNVYNIANSSLSTDTYILKLTDEGDFIWAQSAGGYNDDLGIDIAVDDLQNVFLVGSYGSDPMNFEDISISNNSVMTWEYDNYYCKIGTCATIETIAETSCDSYTSPGGIINTTSSGYYVDVLPNAMGCDSILGIDLTMFYSSEATFSPDVCEFFESPSGNYVWTQSGLYFDTIPNMAGCDSVMIFQLDFINNQVTQNGQTLTANESDGLYQWINCEDNSPIVGADEQLLQISANGSYAVIIEIGGCSDTSQCFTYTDIGINDVVLNNIYIFQILPVMNSP